MCAKNTPTVIRPRRPSSAGQRVAEGLVGESARTISGSGSAVDDKMIGGQSGFEAGANHRTASLELSRRKGIVKQRMGTASGAQPTLQFTPSERVVRKCQRQGVRRVEVPRLAPRRVVQPAGGGAQLPLPVEGRGLLGEGVIG